MREHHFFQQTHDYILITVIIKIRTGLYYIIVYIIHDLHALEF